MKNILCVIVLSTLLVGCTTQNPNDIHQAGTSWCIEEFDEHSYVIRSGESGGYGSGIAHNPKCSCTSK